MDVVLVQHTKSQSAECLACSVDLGVDLLVEGTISGDDNGNL